MCRGKGHWDTAQTEHSSAREDMCTTGQPDSAAARGAGPARPAGVSKVCQGVSTAQAVLPECDQRGRSEGNQIRSSLRACVCVCVRRLMLFKAMWHASHSRKMGLVSSENREGKCLSQGHTAH